MTAGARAALAALSAVAEPDDRKFAALLTERGPEQLLTDLRTDAVPASLAPAAAAARRVDGARLLERAEARGLRLLCPDDEEWSPRLADLDTYGLLAPQWLWARGPAPLAATLERSVAIVGSRAATDYGLHVAGELAYELALRGWVTVSGAAYGIDGAAHRGALAAGVPTVAVLACGVDRPYPKGHQHLLDQIAATGLIVSEWPPGRSPTRLRFLFRNRVIAALSRGTVVVEAATRSGARRTASDAVALSRPLLAVPGPITSVMSQGCHQLLWERAADVVLNVDTVLEAVAPIGEELALPFTAIASPRDRLGPVTRAVLEHTPKVRAQPARRIAETASLEEAQVVRALEALAEMGLVRRVDDRFRLEPTA